MRVSIEACFVSFPRMLESCTNSIAASIRHPIDP